MERKGEGYSIDEVLPFVGDGKREFDGDLIKMNSKRYYTFQDSLVCYECGIKGSIL